MNTEGIGSEGKSKQQTGKIPRQVKKLQKQEENKKRNRGESNSKQCFSLENNEESDKLTEAKRIKLRDSYCQFLEDNLRNEAGLIFSGKTLRWKMLKFPAIAKLSMIQWIHANNLPVEISSLRVFSTYSGELIDMPLNEKIFSKNIYTYLEEIIGNV